MNRADEGIGTPLGGNGNPSPVPHNMAEAMFALVNATAENARLLREKVQNNRNAPHDNRG
jgi:hypothetical protein